MQAQALDYLELPGHGWRVDRQRLASYVKSRRVALGFTHRRDLAAVTGVHDNTLAKLEKGEPVSVSTLAAIENALGWAPGSATTILRGGEPAQAEAGRVGESTQAQESMDALFADAVRRIMDLDLPDRPGLDAWKQKEELLKIVRKMAEAQRPPSDDAQSGNERAG